MDQYITGSMIKALREARNMTQLQLAERLCVSDKTVSKWETGRGLPDLSLIEPIASALGVSVIELMKGESIVNTNRAANMQRLRFYVCPVCGNVMISLGTAVMSCCGITLPPLEAEAPDAEHTPVIERVEDEYYISLPHEMTKTHFISFLAAVRDNACELVKLYPEGPAEARFRIGRTRQLYWYCTRQGLYTMRIR